VRNAADAEDVVQESFLRAFQYSGFRGGNVRAWLLTIVRNTSYTSLRKRRAQEATASYDEQVHTRSTETADPEQLLLKNADRQRVENLLCALPVRFREILVLREFEGLSYQEIADVLSLPTGTVMSTLSRARDRFRQLATTASLHRIEGPCVNSASFRSDTAQNDMDPAVNVKPAD
jgi:RNA polymerase sigma-70 factor (ECF subfamily)